MSFEFYNPGGRLVEMPDLVGHFVRVWHKTDCDWPTFVKLHSERLSNSDWDAVLRQLPKDDNQEPIKDRSLVRGQNE